MKGQTRKVSKHAKPASRKRARPVKQSGKRNISVSKVKHTWDGARKPVMDFTYIFGPDFIYDE